jgi:hypothetical protein
MSIKIPTSSIPSPSKTYQNRYFCRKVYHLATLVVIHNPLPFQTGHTLTLSQFLILGSIEKKSIFFRSRRRHREDERFECQLLILDIIGRLSPIQVWSRIPFYEFILAYIFGKHISGYNINWYIYGQHRSGYNINWYMWGFVNFKWHCFQELGPSLWDKISARNVWLKSINTKSRNKNKFIFFL